MESIYGVTTDIKKLVIFQPFVDLFLADQRKLLVGKRIHAQGIAALPGLEDFRSDTEVLISWFLINLIHAFSNASSSDCTRKNTDLTCSLLPFLIG
jgi:hypothetical protein